MSGDGMCRGRRLISTVGASRRAHRIPTPGIPRVLAPLARAPFAGAKGAETCSLRHVVPPLWMDVPPAEAPACAGMTGFIRRLGAF